MENVCMLYGKPYGLDYPSTLMLSTIERTGVGCSNILLMHMCIPSLRERKRERVPNMQLEQILLWVNYTFGPYLLHHISIWSLNFQLC